MEIYIILIIFALLLSNVCKYNFYFGNKTRKKVVKGKNIYLILMCALMTLIMSLRSTNVGIDTDSYTRIFSNAIRARTISDSIENSTISAPLYIIFCRILGLFSNNPYSMIVFSALFINIFLGLYISRTSEDYPLSVFFWISLALFYFSMNGCRQTMAMVLVLNSIYYLSDNIKSIKGWVYFISALLIHYSSICIIIGLLLALITKRIKRKNVAVVLNIIISTLLSNLTWLLIFIGNIIPKYKQYIDANSKHSIVNETGNGRIIILYVFLGCLIIFGLFLNYRKNKEMTLDDKSEKYHKNIIPLITFGIFFGVFNYRNELISRMMLFYLSFFISFIPSLLKNSRLEKKTELLIKVSIMIVIGIYGILTLVENKNGVVPYELFKYE